MSEPSFNRQPVPASDQQWVHVFGQPVQAAEDCLGCEPVLSPETIAKQIGVKVTSRQRSLMDAPESESGKIILGLGRGDQERVIEEFKQRAAAGADGSCENIGCVADCWRRDQTSGETTV